MAKLSSTSGPADAIPAERLRLLDELAARAAAQAAAENFPVALRLVPRGPRAQLTRVYAFARFVDDVGDEAPVTADERLRLLADIAADVGSLGSGGPAQLLPVAGLRPLLAAGVPIQPFLDLIAANVQDQQVPRYMTYDDLLGYCALSAAPVGRIVLHLAGAATPANVAASDAVCAALQVLEHCQDVGEDARAGRVYLPLEELRGAGVDEAALAGRISDAALRRVVARQVNRSRAQLDAGRGLARALSGWARLAVAGYVAGGLATADALRRADHAVLESQLRPAKGRVVAHAARMLAAGVTGRAASRPSRGSRDGR